VSPGVDGRYERASHSCVYTGRGVEAMRQRLCVCRVRRHGGSGRGRLNHSVSRLDRRRPGPGVFLFLSVTM